MMKKSLFPLFLILVLSFCEAKPPALTSRDTRVKIEEILKAHVSHQKLTPELIGRAFQNYLDEVDPGKVYFLENDIILWTNPSEDLLNQSVALYKKEDFSPFMAIHEILMKAIERRNVLEKKVQATPLATGVQASEFKDIAWAKSEDELLTRLIRIKALQVEATEKFDKDSRLQFLQKIEKRRLKREEELIAHSPTEHEQMVFSLVLKAVSSALDSQTTYFTPAEANQFMIQVQQRLFGIGAQLRDDLNGFTIVRLLEGGPALLSNNLKVGDKIIAVDGEAVVGMEITEAVEHIRGAQGSMVQLTILRESEESGEKAEARLEINIRRGEIVLKESRLETKYEPYGDGIIPIIHLFSFYQDNATSSGQDVQAALEELKKDHRVRGLILDLRNNPGGLLPQAVAVTGLFIKKGVVVSVKDNTGAVQRLRNIEDKIAWDGPLIILTNRCSASAAEIVAGSLQDYGRALIVGDTTTFGKGTFQTFTLESANYGKVNPKGEYKVTRGRYYTVSGKSPQLVGVRPDIVVPGIYSQLDIGEEFSKFPLDSDQIPAAFADDLMDIPPSHRNQIQKLYHFNLQPVVTSYQPYLELLKANSSSRMSSNLNYQNFLKEIEKKELISDPSELFGQTDLQLAEALNVMKDLIALLEGK